MELVAGYGRHPSGAPVSLGKVGHIIQTWLLRNSYGTSPPALDTHTPSLKTISSRQERLMAAGRRGTEASPQRKGWKQGKELPGHHFQQETEVYTVLFPWFWLSGTLKRPSHRNYTERAIIPNLWQTVNLPCFLCAFIFKYLKENNDYLPHFIMLDDLTGHASCLKTSKSPSGALVNSLCLWYLNRWIKNSKKLLGLKTDCTYCYFLYFSLCDSLQFYRSLSSSRSLCGGLN